MGNTAGATMMPIMRNSQPRLMFAAFQITPNAAMISAQATTVRWVTMWMCRGLASRTRYVLYTSNVNTEDTAICCADDAEVTARNSRMSIATAPLLPQSATAAAGAVRPAVTCSVVSVAMAGSLCISARAARPMLVANTNGIGNHAAPPKKKPSDAVLGCEAIERWWYDWSVNTVANAAQMLITP